MERTPMKVKIISGTDLNVLESQINSFLETENLDTYNVIDNVVNNELSFTILHRIKPDMPEEELEQRVEAKLVEAQANESE